MKKLLLVPGILLLLAALCAGAVTGKLPKFCGEIADALDRGVLVAVSENQVRFPLGGDLGWADAIKGLSKDHDDATFRYYNVHPQCGDATTMVERAYADGVLKPVQYALGFVGGILILVGALGRSGGGFKPSFATG